MTKRSIAQRLARIEAQRQPTDHSPGWLAADTEDALLAALAALPGPGQRITGYLQVSPADWDNTP
jgi:hypothetical protein